MENQENRQLNPARIKGGEYARMYYVVTAEHGTTQKDMQKPGFWAHVANQLRPYDRIEARCDDGTFFAEYLVLSCGRSWAKVKELSFISLTSADVSQTEADSLDGYEIKWKGPHVGYAAIRTSDSTMLTSDKDKTVVQRWLEDYVKTVA